MISTREYHILEAARRDGKVRITFPIPELPFALEERGLLCNISKDDSYYDQEWSITPSGLKALAEFELPIARRRWKF